MKTYLELNALELGYLRAAIDVELVKKNAPDFYAKIMKATNLIYLESGYPVEWVINDEMTTLYTEQELLDIHSQFKTNPFTKKKAG